MTLHCWTQLWRPDIWQVDVFLRSSASTQYANSASPSTLTRDSSPVVAASAVGGDTGIQGFRGIQGLLQADFSSSDSQVDPELRLRPERARTHALKLMNKIINTASSCSNQLQWEQICRSQSNPHMTPSHLTFDEQFFWGAPWIDPSVFQSWRTGGNMWNTGARL